MVRVQALLLVVLSIVACFHTRANAEDRKSVV